MSAIFALLAVTKVPIYNYSFIASLVYIIQCHSLELYILLARVYSQDRLLSLTNAVTWLICSAWKFEHITPLLHDLYWLQMPQQIGFKLIVLAFHCLHCMAPPCLAYELCHAAVDFVLVILSDMLLNGEFLNVTLA